MESFTSQKTMCWCWISLLLLGLLVSGCGESGRLLITLQRPTDKTLDPMEDARLSKFSLRIIQDGLLKDQETFRTQDNTLDVGNVPVGELFDLRLAGKSSTGQMLGLGLVFGVEVSAEEETAVEVKFRKPIGFVAGVSGLEVLDVTASTREKVTLPPIKSSSPVSSVAASPDGSWLLLITGSTLQVFRTADQKPWAEVPLAQPGSCLAVSPDNRYAVVCHAEQQEISVVNLLQLAGGNASVRQVPLNGAPSRVVFGSSGTPAQVLVNGVGYKDGCEMKSGVTAVDLGLAKMVQQRSLGLSVADLAVDPRDGSLLAALPCDSALGRVSGGKLELIPVDVPQVYDLAVADQELVVMGSTGGDPLEGRAVSFDLSRSGFSPQCKRFNLPGLSVWFSSSDPDSRGNLGWLLDRDRFVVYDLILAPDGQRALALYQAHYVSNIPPMNLDLCSYITDLWTTGYLLVDLTAESLLFSQPTSMEFQKCSTCIYPDQFSCVSWFKQGMTQGGVLAYPEFEPRGQALLFGGT